MTAIGEGQLLLLDTHVWLWLVRGDPGLTSSARKEIKNAAKDGRLRISVITVWEVGKLAARKRIVLGKPVAAWIEDALANSGTTVEALTPQIAATSCELPDGFRSDPGDEIIIATARAISANLVTRDRKILEYAATGYVRATRA